MLRKNATTILSTERFVFYALSRFGGRRHKREFERNKQLGGDPYWAVQIHFSRPNMGNNNYGCY